MPKKLEIRILRGTTAEINATQLAHGEMAIATDTDRVFIGTATGKVGVGSFEVATHSALSSGVHGVSGSVVGTENTQTLLNKRINPRVQVITSSDIITPNADTTDILCITALAHHPVYFQGPSGTPVNGQRLIIRIRDNGTTRQLTWNTSFYVAGGVPLPTATVPGKTLHIGFIYNTDNDLNRWMCVAMAQE